MTHRAHIERRIAAAVAGFCLAAPGVAQAQTLEVHNDAGVPAPVLQRMETAISREVNGPVHAAYPSAPTISWGQVGSDPNAWPVYLEPAQTWAQSPSGSALCQGFWGYGCFGYHSVWTTPQAVWVSWTNSVGCWGGICTDQALSENTLAHEVIEAATDPTGTGPEICDPVTVDYPMDGDIVVAAFVRPDGSVWNGWPVRHRRHHHRRRARVYTNS